MWQGVLGWGWPPRMCHTGSQGSPGMLGDGEAHWGSRAEGGEEIILLLLSADSACARPRTRAPPAVTSNPSMAMREALLSLSYLKHGATEAQTCEDLCSMGLSAPAVNTAGLSLEPDFLPSKLAWHMGWAGLRHRVSLSWAVPTVYPRP